MLLGAASNKGRPLFSQYSRTSIQRIARDRKNNSLYRNSLCRNKNCLVSAEIPYIKIATEFLASLLYRFHRSSGNKLISKANYC